jgi:hypothetical protein
MNQKNKRDQNFRPRPRPTPPPSKEKGGWFFGWNNVKWFIREIGKLYSGQSSYFSKKRIESGFSFIVGQIGMILFLIFRYQTISMYDFIMWASLEFAVGGYITWQIQRQKKFYGYDQRYDGNYGNEYDYDTNSENSNGYFNGQYNGMPGVNQNCQDPEPTAPPPDAGHTSFPT